MKGSTWKAGVILVALAAAIGYLHDPPWIGRVTSGLRPWERDASGLLFRWTAGRGTFFVPADAEEIALPLRSVFPGAVDVDVRADDRWLATIRLSDPDAWVRTRLPLGGRATRRRYRRIDLHVSRVVPPFMLGVMVGQVEIERRPVGPQQTQNEERGTSRSSS